MTGTEARTPPRLKVLLLAVYAAAAAALVLSVSHLGSLPQADHAALGVGLMVSVERFSFNVSLGKSKIVVDWIEAGVVIGLVLLSWAWLVLLIAATLTVVEFARK